MCIARRSRIFVAITIVNGIEVDIYSVYVRLMYTYGWYEVQLCNL